MTFYNAKNDLCLRKVLHDVDYAKQTYDRKAVYNHTNSNN